MQQQRSSSTTSSASTSEPSGERDPELARTEAEIARTRDRVAGSILALRREVARRTDWREWVRRRPWSFVGGALLLGFLLGTRRRHHG